MADGDAQVLGLEDGPALVARLGDQGDPLARQVVAERLERVEVGVGPEQAGVRAVDDVAQPRLLRLAVRAGLGEAGGEDDREPRLLVEDRLERLDGVAGEDHGEVDVVVDIVDRPR